MFDENIANTNQDRIEITLDTFLTLSQSYKPSTLVRCHFPATVTWVRRPQLVLVTITCTIWDYNAEILQSDWENKCIFSAFFKVILLGTHRGVASKALSKNHNGSLRSFKRWLAC